MEKKPQYYYGDEAGKAVGPLSLDEIRKFAAAGVVPADVTVCEAGGENWRCLNTIYEKGAVDPAALSDSLQNQAAIPDDPVRVSANLKWVYIIALVSSLISFGFEAASTRAALGNGGMDPNSVRETFIIPLWLVAGAASLALLYQLIRAIPERHRFTTPIKAVGFYIIPVFSIYWVFQLFPGIIGAIRKWSGETTPSFSRKIVWFIPFALVVAVGIALDEILLYLDLFGYFENSDYFKYDKLRSARLTYTGLSVAKAASYALFFHFTLSAIHLIRGLLDPEDYEEENRKVKPRRSFSLDLGSLNIWNPSFAYAFFIIAIGTWR